MTRLVQVLLVKATTWPRLTLVAVGLITIAFASVLPDLKIETDGRAFVPTRHPTVERDAAVRELFGLRDPLLVALETRPAESAFGASFLARLRDATQIVQAVPGIDADAVTSLATLYRIGRAGDRRRLASVIAPATDEAVPDVRSYVEAIPYMNLLVSRDGSAALIVAALEPAADRDRTYRDVLEALRQSNVGDVHLGGALAAESQLGAYVIRDLVTMLPLVSAVVGAALFLTYRSLRAVVLPILEVGIVIVWTFGLMALCGSPVYIVTAILPVILMAVGVADEIHIFGHYHELVVRDPTRSRAAIIVEAVEQIRLPILFAAATTGLGFLSFGSASMPPLRSFGIYTAFGVVAAMLLTLTFVPAALMLLPLPVGERKPDISGAPRRRWVVRALEELGRAMHERRWMVLVAGGVVVLGCLPGVSRLEVQDSWFGNFATQSDVRRAGELLDAKFAGSHEVDVVLDAGAAGGALDPAFLGRVDRLQGALRSIASVGATIAVSDLMKAVLQGTPAGDALPRSPAEASQLVAISSLGGQFDADRFLDAERRRTVVRIFLRHANYKAVAAFLSELTPLLKAGFAHEAEIVGDAILSQTTVSLIVRDQLVSLSVALVAVFLAASVMFRSFVGGLMAVFPVSVAVTLNFAVMGYFGIALGIATSMFASLAMGIGVDYSIHFLARFGTVLGEREWHEAARLTLATTGRGIFYNAVVVAAGFLVLGASAMPPNHYLGILVALSMVSSFVATVTLLPALLGVVRPAFLRRIGR